MANGGHSISGRYLVLTVNMTGAMTTTLRVSLKTMAVFTSHMPANQNRAESISHSTVAVAPLRDTMVLLIMPPQMISSSFIRSQNAGIQMKMSP